MILLVSFYQNHNNYYVFIIFFTYTAVNSMFLSKCIQNSDIQSEVCSSHCETVDKLISFILWTEFVNKK